MGQYLSPGVYVEEVPPLARPIAGVGTSTPGFIGVIPDTIQLPSRPLAGETIPEPFRWVQYTLQAEAKKAYRITSWNDYVKLFGDFIGNNTTPTKKVVVEGTGDAANTYVTGVSDPGLLVTATWKSTSKTATADPNGTYKIEIDTGTVESGVTVTAANGTPTKKVVVEGTGNAAKTYVTGVTNSGASVTATWGMTGSQPATATADQTGNYKIEIDKGAAESGVTVTTTIATSGAKVNAGQRHLAHAVYGFFNNGGTSCYVLRISSSNDLRAALQQFAAVGEITMVAAPGLATATAYSDLMSHCELLKDRVALLDSVETVSNFTDLQTPLSDSHPVGRSQNSDYAAFYFPWVKVFDPATSLIQSKDKGDGLIFVPPSGHIAGVYARSDSTRGVFKAPANEALKGVTSLKYALSKADQDGLNGVGVNVIRSLIGAFRVWGARTVGGDANGEYRHISTRRYFNYLRESIDRGTQFVVFEPNSTALWERIKRTVGDFLLREWRSGALFGTTPDKAFWVKCDADTNPSAVREAGQVVTEIGIAIVKPAEFVIFRIQQMAGS